MSAVVNGMLEVPVDLNDLLATTTVECVHTVDAAKLKSLLEWVVEGMQKQNYDTQSMKNAIEENTTSTEERLTEAQNDIRDLRQTQVNL